MSETIRKAVQEKYASVAQSGLSSGTEGVKAVAEAFGYTPEQARRHEVLPGITGWAQVNLPYCSETEDHLVKLEFDLYYVKNASAFLDLIILLETVEVVLWGKGSR